MHGIEHLIEQHILEYESRQKHVDELLERAHDHAKDKPETKEGLDELVEKHHDLVSDLHALKQGKADARALKAIEDAGTVGVWLGFIRDLETFVGTRDKD